MEKIYKEIEFTCGSTIETAIKELNSYKQKNKLVFGEFNGTKLYSDVDDINSAYEKITGKTKAEFDNYLQKQQLEWEEHKRKHEESIPDLTKEWIEKGSKVLDEKYIEYWNKIVPTRLKDLYEGMELGACLAIVAALNSGCDLDVAKKMIEDQGHSGMSFGLVCLMVKSFCDRGDEFVNFVKY